jgi:SHS2 domain-containing protein
LKNGYRFLEHTADMGIEAEGGSLEELFANAARGLRDMIFDTLPRSAATTAIEISLEGFDKEELLVSWLNEILYIIAVRHFVPLTFEVLAVAEKRISARLSGVGYKDEIGIQREVKAATYHGLKLEQVAKGWRARLFVDL